MLILEKLLDCWPRTVAHSRIGYEKENTANAEKQGWVIMEDKAEALK